MINFPPDLDAAHDALASLYSNHLERELDRLLPPGTIIILTDGHLAINGSIKRHTLNLSPERSTATLHLELCPGHNPAKLGDELTLELRGYPPASLPASIPCRQLTLSLNSHYVYVTVDLLAVQPARAPPPAREQKILPSAAECQHFIASNADDLCLVLTRGSLMEPGELAPRCKDALRLLFSESARQQPAQVCHELARTLATLQSEADEHPLLWPDHIRQKAADLRDQLNRLGGQPASGQPAKCQHFIESSPSIDALQRISSPR